MTMTRSLSFYLMPHSMTTCFGGDFSQSGVAAGGDEVADADDAVVRVAVDVDEIVAKHSVAVAINAAAQLSLLTRLLLLQLLLPLMMMLMLRMNLTTGSTTYQAHYEVLEVLMVLCVTYYCRQHYHHRGILHYHHCYCYCYCCHDAVASKT